MACRPTRCYDLSDDMNTNTRGVRRMVRWTAAETAERDRRLAAFRTIARNMTANGATREEWDALHFDNYDALAHRLER